MRYTPMALIVASFALTMQFAHAGDQPPPPPEDDVDVMDELDDDDFGPARWFGRGERRGPGRHFGPARHDMRDRGPDQRGPRRHGERRDFGPGMARMWDRLDLTDAQKQQFVDVMTSQFRAGLEAKMELAEAENAARELRRQDDVTPEQIVAANTAVGTAKGKLEVVRRNAKQELRNILTPEQVEKLEARRTPPPPRDGKGPGPRGPRGPEKGPRPPKPPKGR